MAALTDPGCSGDRRWDNADAVHRALMVLREPGIAP
jgi:hypothetical protein